jgi:hypothetical protein
MLAALKKGFLVVSIHMYDKLIEEGDSILVNALKQILNITQVDKLTHNWRVSSNLEGIANSISLIPTIIPLHVKHKANCLADRLANERILLATQELDVS